MEFYEALRFFAGLDFAIGLTSEIWDFFFTALWAIGLRFES